VGWSLGCPTSRLASNLVTRLGAYVLPGRVDDPRPAIAQARAAEELGLGSIWVSERWATKELGALCGALSQVTTRTRIAVGATHLTTRHPVTLAGLGMTMQMLSEGRFVLGVVRSAGMLRSVGIPVPTTQAMKDYATILRRLWAGETVSYDGPAGSYHELRLPDAVNGMGPPVILAAMGPMTLALAGSDFDGVLLSPCLTLEGVRRSVEIVRNAAVDAGRDPASVEIVGTLIVAPDLSRAEQEAVVGGRVAGYLQDPRTAGNLSRINGWDTASFEPLQNHPMFSGPGTAADGFRRAELVEVSRLIPSEILSGLAATGTAAECAVTVRDFLQADVDELVLHGATPEQCSDLVREVRALEVDG
jgi:5,10-methylenetetrahydromethanopterin reductase